MDQPDTVASPTRGRLCVKRLKLSTESLLLIPKLQSHFDEFLQQGYLKSLGVLHSSTCGGLRYVFCKAPFSWKKCFVCVCVCVFIKLHITTQSGPVILVILCHSH